MRRALVVVGVLVVAGAIAWWLLSRRGESSATSAGSSTGSATASASGGPRGRVVPTRTGGRKLSGRVLFRNAPIQATVWLVGDRRTAVVTKQTAPDGTFALVDLPADEYTLAAFAPKVAGRTVEIDLRTADRDGVTLRLQPCERELAGRVVDNSGGAITGARLDGGGASTLSGADGRFVLCTANTSVDVVARADGYAAEQRSLGSGDTDVIFELRPEVVVSGRVTLDGAPAPNAIVVAAPDGDRTWDSTVLGNTTVTGADGTFELRGIGAGDYVLSSRAEGARTLKGPHVHLELANNAPIELQLVRTIDVKGRAHVGADPAAGVGIEWSGDSGDGSYATTDDKGEFTLPSVIPSAGEVSVPGRTIAGGGKRVAGKDAFDLELSAGLDGTIRGRVVSRGAPVADARIIAREQTTSGDSDPRTRDDGTFEMRLRGGTVHIAAESDELGVASDDVAVEVKANATTPEVVLDLTRTASVAGTIVDETGAPIEGATIQLAGEHDETQLLAQSHERGLGVANASGAFRIAMLVPQSYAIRVTIGSRGVELVKGSTSKVLVKSPGEAIEGVTVAVVAKRAAISGRVVDDRGAPVADASIQVRGAGAHRRADADGRFSISVLARGTYQLVARGRPGSETTISDVKPGTTDLVITLPAPGSIEVVCPAAVERVEVYSSSGAVMHAPCGAVIERLPVGHVLVKKEGRDEKVTATFLAQGDVVSGKKTTLSLADVGTRVIELKVTGGGKPLDNILCLVDQAGGNVFSTPTMYITSKEGITYVTALKAPSRLSCQSTSDAWSSYTRQIDAETTELAIELPPASAD